METGTNLGNLAMDWGAELKHCAVELSERMVAREKETCQGAMVQMEDFVVHVTQQLGQEVLRILLARQARVDEHPLECPKCGRPCSTCEARPRAVMTRLGEVNWSEPVQYCLSCRRSFSPSVGTIAN